MRNLPRRKRNLAITAGAGLLFTVASILAVWLVIRPGEVYRPGEEIEGLTRGLDRSLPDDYPRVTFTDVTSQAGIEFRHFAGSRSSQLPEDMGSGAAWGDYDNDGWPDLFVANLAGPLTLTPDELESAPAHSALYHNQGDGTFTEVSERAGVMFRGMDMAGAWGDYDGDGWRDLFVSTYGQNRLYRNTGDGTFQDVTRTSGIAGHVGYWAGAAWADYDQDGDLDLYVAGYVKYSSGAGGPTSLQYEVEVPASLNPSSFRPERNLLFRNRGDGTFQEVAGESGVDGREGRSLGVSWADFDGDGLLDLYVANDVSDNALYRNLGDGTFRDVSHAALVSDYRGAMGLAVGDWDGDEDPDIFVTHWIAQENALFSSMRSRLEELGRPASSQLQFMDEADRHGLGQIALDYIGWGTSFFDYDNDGKLDLLVVNGSTFQEPEEPERLVAMPDKLFWNRGAEDGFFDVSTASGAYFGRTLVGRGAAFGDYDNDGDVDVFIVNNDGPGVLLRNDGGNRNAWLKVRLTPRAGGADPVGARLRLVAGAQVQSRYAGAQGSYLSQNSAVEHFGLGAVAGVDTLEVFWPGGGRELFTQLAPNQTIDLVEGAGIVKSEAGTMPGQAALAGAAPGGLPVEGETASVDRDAVLRFWELYRSATRHRVGGRPSEAAAEYEAALQIDPEHENTLYWLGNMRFDLGDQAGAARAWERLLAVNPRDARVHRQVGVIHTCVGGQLFDPQRAAAEFGRALEINQEETGSLLWLGQVALLRGRTAEAQDYLGTVLRSNPQSSEAHFLVGYIAWKKGLPEEAAASFTKALDTVRPYKGEESGLSEGDTESGRAMLADATHCETPASGAGELIGLADSDPSAEVVAREMETRYRKLDALLNRARSGG